jgi:hypothetical protein
LTTAGATAPTKPKNASPKISCIQRDVLMCVSLLDLVNEKMKEAVRAGSLKLP